MTPLPKGEARVVVGADPYLVIHKNILKFSFANLCISIKTFSQFSFAYLFFFKRKVGAYFLFQKKSKSNLFGFGKADETEGVAKNGVCCLGEIEAGILYLLVLCAKY